MDQPKLALGITVALLGALSIYQRVTISGLEQRLALAEQTTVHAPASTQLAPTPATLLAERREGAGRAIDDLLRNLPATGGGSTGIADASEDQVERKEHAKQLWLESMHDEIEAYAIEENISEEDTRRVQALAEDFLMTLTDLRRAIYEGDISAAQGRADMKEFQAEHERRMTEILGEAGYKHVQRRIGRQAQ